MNIRLGILILHQERRINMKILFALLFSSVLVLGACGETETPGDELENNAPETEEGTQGNEETDEGENLTDSESEGLSTDDQLNFIYNPEEVNHFELHIELLTSEEWSYDFDRDDQEAEIEYENGSDTERQGEEVFQEIENLLTAIEINHERPISAMIDDVLDVLEINQDELEEIDLEIETMAGEKLGFKYHIAEQNESATIDEFNMDIRFVNREEWDYEYERDDSDFSIEYSDREDLSNEESLDEMERILTEVTIDLDQSIGDLKAAFLSSIDVDFSEVEEWDFEVEFEDQMKIGAKFDR